MSETNIWLKITSVIKEVITLLINLLLQKHKSQLKTSQEMHKEKREKLNNVYIELIDIINKYPKTSPSDVLKRIEYAPNYSMEHFDAVLNSLDYQIEDYHEQLNNSCVNFEIRNDINTQISNREYAKKKISEIKDKYYIAKNKHGLFCETDKAVFDLYAGQDVKNRLVEFEVVIHNTFISGYCVDDADDSINNRIEVIRRELINSMRNDIGTY